MEDGRGATRLGIQPSLLSVFKAEMHHMQPPSLLQLVGETQNQFTATELSWATGHQQTCSAWTVKLDKG